MCRDRIAQQAKPSPETLLRHVIIWQIFEWWSILVSVQTPFPNCTTMFAYFTPQLEFFNFTTSLCSATWLSGKKRPDSTVSLKDMCLYKTEYPSRAHFLSLFSFYIVNKTWCNSLTINLRPSPYLFWIILHFFFRRYVNNM